MHLPLWWLAATVARIVLAQRCGRCSALDFLLPVQVPVRHHAALRLRRSYRAVAHLPVFEVLKLVFLMEARRGRSPAPAISS